MTVVGRRRARECAFQLLYQYELSGKSVTNPPEQFWRESGADDDARSFAQQMVQGVCDHSADLDERIEQFSTNWRVGRMAAVDKSILRMAAYELCFCPEIPSKVVINEAVELAKRFGTRESGSFVNGILDALARDMRRDVVET